MRPFSFTVPAAGMGRAKTAKAAFKPGDLPLRCCHIFAAGEGGRREENKGAFRPVFFGALFLRFRAGEGRVFRWFCVSEKFFAEVFYPMQQLAKRIFLTLSATAALLLSLSLCLAACSQRHTAAYEVVVNRGEQFIFTATDVEGNVSLYDALVQLREEERVAFDGYTGDYGFTLTAVNGIENKADWSACWMIYTDLTEYGGVIYATPEYTFTYGDKTYAQATYGASSLPVVAGYTYALHYDTFS